MRTTKDASTIMDLHLKDKVALVTGGASGFGLAIAGALIEEGCTVYLGDLNLPALERAASRLGPSAHGLELDVGEAQVVQDGVNHILMNESSLDILVNNAGVLKTGSVVEASIEDWNEVCRVNLSGVYYCSKAVLPSMLSRKAGKIINIASISAYRGGGVFGNVLYGTTKAGVIALTKGFARDVGPFGVNVNAVAPGLADTGMTSHYLSDAKRAAVAEAIPCGRLATTGDIAKAVVFLASEAASYITGETICVDGGFLTK